MWPSASRVHLASELLSRPTRRSLCPQLRGHQLFDFLPATSDLVKFETILKRWFISAGIYSDDHYRLVHPAAVRFARAVRNVLMAVVVGKWRGLGGGFHFTAPYLLKQYVSVPLLSNPLLKLCAI